MTSSLDPPKTTVDYEAADDCPVTAGARERLATLIAAARGSMPARTSSGSTDPNLWVSNSSSSGTRGAGLGTDERTLWRAGCRIGWFDSE